MVWYGIYIKSMSYMIASEKKTDENCKNVI